MFLYLENLTQDVQFGPRGGRKLSKEDMTKIRKFKKGTLTKCISDLTVKDCLLIITMDISIKPGQQNTCGTKIQFEYSFLRYVPAWLYKQVKVAFYKIIKQNHLAAQEAEQKWILEYRKRDYMACYCPFTGKRYQSPYHVPQYTPDERAFMSYMSQVKVDIMTPREATPFVTQHKYESWLGNCSIQNVFSTNNKNRDSLPSNWKVPSQTKSKLELDRQARRSQMW